MANSLRDLGEKGFIREVLADYAATARLDQIDDGVVVDLSEAIGVPGLPHLVYSVDHPGMIDRPIPPETRWRFRGRWAAACTCNDVLAMGARPVGFALDLAMPDNTAIDEIRQFYDGVTDVLDVYGTALEGGNIDASPQFETVAVCWGIVAPDRMVRRTGARAGDYLAVTTVLGIGWASYLLHRRGLFQELPAAVRAELDRYNLLPLAPHRPILESVQSRPGAITSGMDLTDGLLEFPHSIREQAGLGVVIDERSIPISPALASCAALLGVTPPMLAVEYGYDTPRAFGFTVDRQHWDTVSEIFSRHGTPLYRIGQVTAEPHLVWRAAGGGSTRLPPFWYDQYRPDDIIESWQAAVKDLAGPGDW